MKTPKRVWITWQPDAEQEVGGCEAGDIAWDKAAANLFRRQMREGEEQAEYILVPVKKGKKP